jgi:dTDP-4-amino-4,6-dideoxygalactose transaminase
VRVPLRDIAAETAELRPALDTAIARVLDSGRFIGGPEVESFERELAAAAGCAHAIGVSSGTDALLVSLMALGIRPGDEVITTPFTFFATAGAIARLGASPVFADIDPDTFHLDPGAVSAARTARTRAILPVHLFGLPARVPDFARLDLPILEDAAQSLGAAPVRGAAQAVSFFPSKNLGALGDAGAVLTDDPGLADRVRLLRSHGARPKYHHIAVGGNFRLDALQAACLRIKLPHLRRWNESRRAVAARYRELFAAAGLDRVLTLPPDAPEHIYHHFVLRAPLRDQLRAHLAASGIATEVYYPAPLHLQPCFAALGHRAGAFPEAEAAAREVLAIPCHPYLAPDTLAEVVDRIAEFLSTPPRTKVPS